MRRYLLVLLGAMIAVCGFGAARASADAFTWSAPMTVDPIDSPYPTALAGVDCPSASQCTAVDAQRALTFDSAGNVTAGPSVIDAGQSLSSIACPSSSQCTAVDGAGNEVTFDPNAIGYPRPVPIDPGRSLAAVVCPSTHECAAFEVQGRELTFDPTAPGTPTPRNIGLGGVAAAACPSASQCTAVGPGGDEVTFDPASPAQSAPVTVIPEQVRVTPTVTAIACPSNSQCTAIDGGGREATFDPAAPGSPTTVVVTSSYTAIRSLSCPSSAQCSAVGLRSQVTFDPASPSDATETTIDAGAAGPAGLVGLKSVACRSTSQCTAVDGGGNQITFDPTAPGTPSTTTVDRSKLPLNAVACPSAFQCTAVDTQAHQVTFTPSGAITGPPVSLEDSETLNAIGCPSTSQCTALDGAARLISFNPLTSRKPVRTAVQSGPLGTIGDLACPSRSQCTAAVGAGVVTFNPTIPHHALATRPPAALFVACPTVSQCTGLDIEAHEVTFNPRSPGHPTPVAIEDVHHFPNSIACPSASQCTAVDAEGRELTFNPVSPGHVVPVPIDDAGLTRVACPSVLQCTAVDFDGREVTFDPRAPGTTTRTPVPGMGPLTAIACVSVTHCVVVDQLGQGSAGSAPAARPAPDSIAPPRISGTAKQGRTLTERHGSWTNAPIAYSYQWLDCDRRGSNCVPIFGAAGPRYVLRASDAGHTIRVQETATNLGGPSQAASSHRTDMVKATIASVARVRVTGARVRVTIYCRGTASTRCVVALRLSAKTIIASASATLRGGRTRTVQLSPNTAGRRLLARRHRLRAKLRLFQSGRTVFSRSITIGR